MVPHHIAAHLSGTASGKHLSVSEKTKRLIFGTYVFSPQPLNIRFFALAFELSEANIRFFSLAFEIEPAHRDFFRSL
jgi:hypothetical protein